MTIGVAEWLIARGGFDGHHMASRFVANHDAEPWRGYGAGPPIVFDAIRRGAPLARAATALFDGQGSYGNGAAIRAAALGLFALHASPRRTNGSADRQDHPRPRTRPGRRRRPRHRHRGRRSRPRSVVRVHSTHRLVHRRGHTSGPARWRHRHDRGDDRRARRRVPRHHRDPHTVAPCWRRATGSKPWPRSCSPLPPGSAPAPRHVDHRCTPPRRNHTGYPPPPRRPPLPSAPLSIDTRPVTPHPRSRGRPRAPHRPDRRHRQHAGRGRRLRPGGAVHLRAGGRR